MLNSSGAVEQFEVYLTSQTKPENIDGEVISELPLSENMLPVAIIVLKVRGCGRFGVYCSQCPIKCKVGNIETDFNYEGAIGLVTMKIPVPQEEMYRWPIEIQI